MVRPEFWREKVFGSRKDFREDDLIGVHDMLMVEYGWIPIDEFRSLPIPTLINLVNQIRKRKKAEEQAMKKSRRRM